MSEILQRYTICCNAPQSVSVGRSAGTSFTPHCIAYLRSNVLEFFEPKNWPQNSPDLNPVDYAVWGHCSRWCIVTKFHTLTSEMCAYRLLGSAKPGHIELSDRSAAKKTDDGHQGKGCPRGVSSGLTLWENDSCFTVC